MEALAKVLEYTRPDIFKIYTLGDIHAGCKQCAEGEIKKKVAQIKDEENSYWIGMGDYGECITMSDKRWDIGVISDWVDKNDIVESQRQWVRDLFLPIKDKCLLFLTGNHEDKIRREHQHNIYQHLLDDLGLPYAGYSSFLRISFRRTGGEAHEVIGAFTHGAGSARTPGARLNRLVYFMTQHEANFYGYAHLHDLMDYTPQRLGITRAMKIKHHPMAGTLTGCWVRGYAQGMPPSYAEQAVYPPTRLGCAVFEISPDKGRIRVTQEEIE